MVRLCFTMVLVLTSVVAFATAGPVARAQSLGWVRQIGPDQNGPVGIASDSAGNAYVAGFHAGNHTAQDPDLSWVRKYSPDGTQIWAFNLTELQSLGTPASETEVQIDAIAIDSTGIYLAGWALYRPDNGFPFRTTGVVEKRSLNTGGVLWSGTTRGGPRTDPPFTEVMTGVATDGAGHAYVVGYVDDAHPGQTSAGQRDALVIVLDANSGQTAWTHQFGTSAPDEARSVVAAQNAVYIGGTTGGAFPGQTSAGGQDGFVRKLDGNGNEVWLHQYGSAADESVSGLALHPDGSLLIAGAGPLMKVSSAGQPIWSQPSGATTVGVNDEGTILTAERVQDAGGFGDVKVTARSPAGAQLWTFELGSQAYQTDPPDDSPSSIASDRAGGAFVSGHTVGLFPGGPTPGPSRPDVFAARVTHAPLSTPTVTPTSVPRTGGRITFLANWINGVYRVYVMNADGTDPVPLATGSTPSWSPDGQRIVFRGDTGLMTMKADGTDHIPIGDGGDPAWSPDGKKIAFVGNQGIMVMNPDGTGRTVVTAGQAPAWSPDSKRIAYMSDFDLYLIDVDGTMPVQLTSGDPFDSQPAWSPDGRHIAFSRGFEEIHVIDVDGSNEHAVVAATRYDEANVSPAWSPDGTRIVFSRRPSLNAAANLFVVNADGSHLTQLTTQASGLASEPSWTGGSGTVSVIQNPSFEDATTTHGVSYPAGWWWRPAAVRDTSTAHAGAASFRVTGPAPSTYSFENVQLQPSTTYRLQFWVKTQSTAGGRGITMRYNELKPRTIVRTAPWTTGTTDWHEVTYAFTISPQYVSGRLDVYWDLKAGETAWIDDISLCSACAGDTRPSLTAPSSVQSTPSPTATSTQTPKSMPTPTPTLTPTRPPGSPSVRP